MNTRTFLTSLAIATGLLGFTACDNKIESLSKKQFAVTTEMAEILLDCESAADVESAIDEIKELQGELKELSKEAQRSESEFTKLSEEEFTELEVTRMNNRLGIAGAKATGLMQDAMAHVQELCKDDTETLKKLSEAMTDAE